MVSPRVIIAYIIKINIIAYCYNSEKIIKIFLTFLTKYKINIKFKKNRINGILFPEIKIVKIKNILRTKKIKLFCLNDFLK